MSTVRRIDRSYVRDVSGEWTSGGYALVVHLHDAHDVSPAWVAVGRDADPRCGWCYLGANHSADAHRAKVAARVAADVAWSQR